MALPLRIEYPGALYHVTSRGDRQEAIFDDDQDRTAFLNVLSVIIDWTLCVGSTPWAMGGLIHKERQWRT